MNKNTLEKIKTIQDLNLYGPVLSLKTDGIRGDTKLNLDTGCGRSGNWGLDSKRKIRFVVLRVKQKDGSYFVYTGSFVGHQPVKNSIKKVVLIDNLVLAGISWGISKLFNGQTGRGGVTYVELPEFEERPRDYREGSEVTILSRPDQSPFAEDVRENCFHRCVVTGASLRCITEAAHLTPHCDRGLPDRSNGILLRRDIHALFDHHEFAIEPDTLRMHFTKAALESLHPAQFTGQALTRDKMKSFINPENLRKRWAEFTRLHINQFSCDAELESAE